MSEAPRIFAVPGPVFNAKYGGNCWLCDQRISAGERIRYIAKKTVAHAVCVRRGVIHPISDLVLGDERAREKMRSRKPNSWRLGRSPSDYG
jgi:hypothetical protein